MTSWEGEITGAHENVCAGSTVSCFQHLHPGVGLSLEALFIRGWNLGSHIVIKNRQKPFINQFYHWKQAEHSLIRSRNKCLQKSWNNNNLETFHDLKERQILASPWSWHLPAAGIERPPQQSEEHSKANVATVSQTGFLKCFEKEYIKICAFQMLSLVTNILIYVLIDLQKLQKLGSGGTWRFITWIRQNLMIKWLFFKTQPKARRELMGHTPGASVSTLGRDLTKVSCRLGAPSVVCMGG